MKRIQRVPIAACVFALVFCARAFGAAPDTLRGRVTDRSGNAIAGAEVIVEDVGRIAVTRDNGTFVIVAPIGSTIVVRRAGYAPATTIVGGATSALEIVLEASPFMLDPVNVTAARAPSTATGSLGTSALMREQLRREAGVSLAHALDDLPGVRTLSTGEQVGKPVIRGVFGSRVLVLEDALRLEDYSWSDEDAPSIDARFADRVEVVRGPASILYGSDAVGGVVNVIPAPVPQPGSDFRRTGVELSASSNRREGGLVGRTEGSSASLGWRALVVGRFADDFHTPVGPVENTGYGALNGELAVGTQKRWGTLTARYARYAGEFKLLEANEPANPGAGGEEEGPERKLADDRLQLIGAFPVGAVRLEARAQLQRHWLQEVADELTPPGQPKVEAPVFELLLNTLTTDLIAHHSISRALHGSVAASFIAQKNDSRGELPVVPDATISNAALSAVERLDMGPLEWIVGGRTDHHTIDPTETKGLAAGAGTNTDNAASYNAGAVLHVTSNAALRGNVGRAWRAPNLFELYASGPRIGEARYEIGDPTLTPESATELDAGADISGRSFRAQLSLYTNRVKDFIALQPTSDFVDGLRVFRHTQTEAQLRGVEATVELRPLTHVSVVGEYDAVRGTDLDAAAPLPWIPAPRLQAHVELAGPAQRFAHAYGRAGVEHVWAKTRVAAHEPAVEAYTLLGLGAGGETMWRGHAVRIDMAIKNALNTKYTDFLNRYRDFALNPGRDISLRLSYDF